jgi:hypothetical protein
MHTENFYSSLPVVNNFSSISDPSIYSPLPAGWLLAVTDVKNSTDLIRAGRYKEVNLVGASSIMTLLNIDRSVALPFIFGGDGAVVCIPPSFFERSQQSLAATRQMARDSFGIELRVGIVPLSYIREQGFDVRVARCIMSGTYVQPVFKGGGIHFAEECLKDPHANQQFGFDIEHVTPAADFSGLECRWNNVPSRHGEIVSVIVQALGEVEQNRNDLYREVLERIETIYGSDSQCHPVREEMLTMSLREKELMGESRIRSFAKGILYRIRYWFIIRWGVIAGKYLMGNNVRTSSTDWGAYKRTLVTNTDFKKFDDKLRFTVSGNPEQREKLTEYLDRCLRDGRAAYGMHSADCALVTCLIFNYNESHVHLVDSVNGGYANAARQLKEMLATLQ